MKLSFTLFFGNQRWMQLKDPSMPALFSERHGYEKPKLKLFGYRLFWGQHKSAKK